MKYFPANCGISSVFVFLMAWACIVVIFNPEVTSEDPFDASRLEKRVIVKNCLDPMQMAFLGDDRMLFIERPGTLKQVTVNPDAVSENLMTETVVGKIPVAVYGEVGLLGLAIDPKFAETGWIYLFYCPAEKSEVMRLSRFSLANDLLDLRSGVTVLEYAIDSEGAIHMGGGLWMDEEGDLWIGTGDNSPPIPELPVDFRAGRELYDAFRSSANTNDLRGKILRIHPLPAGGYSIPHGNLFTDVNEGRPEIFAMGCRNPFRLSYDSQSSSLLWGDVGPNIDESLGVGPNGFDEFHRTTIAGNFGWPMFVGNNQAYRMYDFATREVGKVFDSKYPSNPSPNNTGKNLLPPPQPAVIWYPSTTSDHFPTLGSGGRSAMSGPVYRSPESKKTNLHLHEQFDGRWFIFDWTRNWIQSVELEKDGSVGRVEPFMPDCLFRKPIDIKVGPDGSLYIIEFGDKWGNNHDSQISRVVYRRGNREPIAHLSASRLAGQSPLEIQLNGNKSLDPDGDTLAFHWIVNGKQYSHGDTNLELTLDEIGSHTVELIVTDIHGAENRQELTVHVGNEPAKVRFTKPANGSFFDWGDTIHYAVDVSDVEDGSTAEQTILSSRILTSKQPVTRRNQELEAHPGLALMRKTTCFSCHMTKAESAGPSYQAVANRYRNAGEAQLEKLAEKVVTGGTGVWGNKPMPSHPQHSLEEAKQMIRWVVSLAENDHSTPQPGGHGFFQTQAAQGNDYSAIILTAEYTDNGAEVTSATKGELDAEERKSAATTLPALRSEAQLILHARRKRAAFADRLHSAQTVDVFEGGVGLVARLGLHGWLEFSQLRLEQIDRVTVQLSLLGSQRGNLSLRENSPHGRILGSSVISPSPAFGSHQFQTVTLPLAQSKDVVDLCIVFEPIDDQSSGMNSSNENNALNIAWLEFHDSPATLARKREAAKGLKRVLLIPTQLDHEWATHMYTDVCRLLAATLNLTPGVEALVSPDLDWPKDQGLLDDVDAIVYYSRPAGDILLSPDKRQHVEKLLERGVGFSAIHWATGAELEVGETYQNILGGWFNFEFSGLKVDRQELVQRLPDHPICKGWDNYILRDEFYMNLRFHADAIPILQVHIDGQDQTVAWVHHRQDDGRSFGTTLGHFHDNFADSRFRKMLANGILWTAGVDIPDAGLPVEISPDLLQVEPVAAPQPTREWNFEELRNELLKLRRGSRKSPSFFAGKRLFDQSSCSACHEIGNNGMQTNAVTTDHKIKLGPDLSGVRVHYAASDDPEGTLLRSIVEPSVEIAEKYRSEILQLDDGTIVSGLVKEERDGKLWLADNPQKPAEVRSIDVHQIEARRRSDTSLMPAGLLNTLDVHEIFELLTFIQAGGDANYVAYREPRVTPESWADNRLPIQNGLRQWLDASSINAARRAMGQLGLEDGSLLGIWPDGSGNQLTVVQRQSESQPIYRVTANGSFVEFDGIDDYLVAYAGGLVTNGFTAMIVVAPNHNRNWPGILSANATGKNDFLTGFNIDLMHEPTGTWTTIMSEGPGYQGVINLMMEDHPWGQFQIVTVKSEPGPDGLSLRINGRPQRSRQRPDQLLQIDELTVGARYWSNDPSIPPFNRGFLSGRIAQVLFYDRPLSDEEMVANEVYLWNANERLLEPAKVKVNATSN